MKRMKTAVAIVAGIVAATGIAANASADVGRLFFSQPERAALERTRRAVEPVVVAPEPEPVDLPPLVVDSEPAPPAPTIRVDGYVRRSDGEATVWVNGENTYDGDLAARGIAPGSARLHGRRVTVTPADSDGAVLLKPGQSYDPNAGATADAYETAVPAEEAGPN